MKTILLLALSAIILSQSYGFAYGADIVAVTTDSSSYQEGEIINVAGYVSDYDGSDPYKNFDVTLRLIAPNGNIVSIYQVPLNSDGYYSTFIPAEGPLWKFDGDYTVSVSHGSDRNSSITFAFVLSEHEIIEEEIIEEAEVIEISEEELAKGCGPGTHLEDGVCMLDEITVESTSVSTGSSPTTGSTSLMYSITFTVLIAFAIMIILYCISRASKTKKAN